MEEELGVRVRSARRLANLRQDYSDRRVWLDTWLIEQFDGEPQSRENQVFAWIPAQRIGDFDVLPSCWRVAAALQLSREYVFTPPRTTTADLLEGLEQLPRRCMLRLRIPGLDELGYADLSKRAIAAARARNISIILDRDPAQAIELGAAGWHATTHSIRRLQKRPFPQSKWFLASAHDATEIEAANALGADAVIVGPVNGTATHPDAVPLGWQRFSQLAEHAGLPAYALGGVGPADLRKAADHGAFGVAAISAYWRGRR